MSNIAAMSLLARYPESTGGGSQGDPPVDAAAWVTSGVRVRHIAEALDISGVARTSIPDERNQERVFATEARVEGLDNPEFAVAAYGHGLGATTASGSQIDVNPANTPGIELVEHLGHAMGGVSRGYSTAVSGAGSTTTVLDVDDASNYEAGDFVAIELTVSGYPAGTAWPRRIIAVDTGAAPDQITLDQALPIAPSDTNAVHACAVAYIDEDVLCNSDGAGGPHTWSWLVQKGLPGAGAAVREAWEFRGCVSTLQSFELSERDGHLKFGFQIMAASHADPTSAPWPTWTTNQYGLAPLAVGPLTEVWLEDDGTSTNTRVHVSSFSVEPGIPRVRTEVATSENDNMQGTASYATQPAETLVTMAIDPFAIARWTEQAAGTYKTLRWARLGPAGSGMAVHFPRVSYVETPKRGVNNATSNSQIQFKAHEDEDLGTMPTNDERWRSKLQIVSW